MTSPSANTESSIAEAKALLNRGDLTGAIAVCERILAQYPDDAPALVLHGVALCQTGNVDAGIDQIRRGAAADPDYAEAFGNLGVALSLTGAFAEAAEALQRAVAINPGIALTQNNLGGALAALGRLDEAAAAYSAAVALQPNLPEAQAGLGAVRFRQGRGAEALAQYRAAVSLRPTSASFQQSLGEVQLSQGHFLAAEAAFLQAAARDPGDATALIRLADLAYQLRDDVPQAIGLLRRALLIDSRSADAIGQLAFLNKAICDWSDFSGDEQRAIDAIGNEESVVDVPGSLRTTLNAGVPDGGAHLISPFVALTVSTTPAQQLTAARRFAARNRTLHAPPPRATDGREKIRLGYLSCDFHDHPTSRLIVELLECHDRSRFDVFGYSYGADDGSALRRRVVAAFDRFTDVTTRDTAAIADGIRADGVDLLIDLKGFTRGTRIDIMAARPAPVQIAYLGYPGTMGADFIDYVLADPFVVPTDQQHFFSEKLVYLPHTYQPNDRKRAIGTTPTRAACGLPENAFVYCCFNNTYKLTPALFDIWMRLLTATPGSVLWLFSANDTAEGNLRREATARGVDPRRLVFAPRVAPETHLARHRLADLFLDTLPYNAHTTMSDALWAGLPAITCAGNTFAGRVGGSLLLAAGLGELVTTSLAEYEAMALVLAHDPGRLRAIRETLDHNRLTTPLFDSAGLARAIETAYSRMWEMYRAGEAPRSFGIPAG